MPLKSIGKEFFMTCEPQFTLDELYITPFTLRRLYDEEGNARYVALQRNTAPSGVRLLDELLLGISRGTESCVSFRKRHGITRSKLSALVELLTGLTCDEFFLHFRLRMADELLRYTPLSIGEVAARSGFGTHTNFCVACQNHYKCTPAARRRSLRGKNDVNRFRLA